MSSGFSSMTAPLGLLAIAGYQIGTRSPTWSVDSGRISPEPTDRAASVACLANWVLAVPARAESSVGDSANFWSVSSRAAKAKRG